ncbi:MAG: hypothetical protein K2X38_03215 [Gemmataceae bacterium]|nr:hypothetical protein [Gemmataceae bacterium]
MKPHASRIARLERIAQAKRADVPVAAVVDVEGGVMKVMGSDGEWSAIGQLRVGDLPDGVKVYGFDPEMTFLAKHP